MGTKTIWLENFEDLPLLLERVAAAEPSAQQRSEEQD
jgi:hypothetical protein